MKKALIIMTGLLIAVSGLLGYSYFQSDLGSNIGYAKESKEQEQEQENTDTEKEALINDAFAKLEATEQEYLLGKIPAKKLEEHTVHYEELITNLKGNSIVVLQLSAIADNKKSTEEAQKREFQVRNFVNSEASMMTKEEMADPIKVEEFLEKVKAHLNEQLDEGFVFEIFVTKKLIQ